MNVLDLNLSALRYFVDAIDLGSLSKSAVKNHVSRPAVSQAIRRIEDSIGFEVMTHSKNRIELTVPGRAFHRKAKAGLEAFARGISGTNEVRLGVKIACSATLAEFFVLPGLKKSGLSDRNEIRIGSSAKIRQLVADDDVRLGILIDDDRTIGFSTEVIGFGKFGLWSKTGKSQTPLITTEDRPEVRKLIEKFEAKRLLPNSHLQVESWTVCRRALDVFGGMCLLPNLISTRGLKPVRSLKFDHSYRILAVYKDRNTLSADEVRLLASLRDRKLAYPNERQ
ncbi:MAG: LysR family transcriptional regulator [Bdellovibrionota bacterium]